MRIFLISNTLFGYKNKKHLNTQLDYFNQFFIPFVQKTASKDDILIHLGNFFDSQNINVNIFNKCQTIFENISQILPIKLLVGKLDRCVETKDNKINTLSIFRNFNNIEIIDETKIINDMTLIPQTKNIIKELDNSTDVILCNIDYKNSDSLIKQLLEKKLCFCGSYNNYEKDEIINIGSPFQLDREWSTNKGFIVFDTITKKHKFIENNSSPRFEKIEIKSTDDLRELESKKDFISKNYVDVVVDQELLTEKKLKVDILLSKYNFSKIEYKGKEEAESTILSEETYNIDKMIYEHLSNLNDEELVKEFENIKKLSLNIGTK